MQERRRVARRWWLALAAAAGCLSLMLVPVGARAITASRPYRPPAITHVWLINLENEGITDSFQDPAADPYLATTLRGMGALLENYYAIGHGSLDNYIAQISGQAPDSQTQYDCPVYTSFAPANDVDPPYHQLVGDGCVYPATVPTLGNQLTRARLTWKAYMEDMGNDPARDGTTQTRQGPACGHPALGDADPTASALATDQYSLQHNPFMYFASVTGDQSYCDQHVLSLQPLLTDLRQAATTPNFSLVGPNRCDDGHDEPCVNGDPGGLTSADSFLQTWIPRIMGSPAYRSGLIIISFDEGSTAQACCGETAGLGPSHPNVAEAGLLGPGGGQIGTLLLSPFIKPGTVSTTDYNHYSVLRSIEDLFRLPHLGDAALPDVASFGPDVYTR